MLSILKAQAGNRILATFSITREGERFSSRLTSHYADSKEVMAELEKLREQNPDASVQVITK